MTDTAIFRAPAGRAPGASTEALRGAKHLVRVPNIVGGGQANTAGDIVELILADASSDSDLDFASYQENITDGDARDTMKFYGVHVADVAATDGDALICIRGKLPVNIEEGTSPITRTSPFCVMDSGTTTDDAAATSYADVTASQSYKCIAQAMESVGGAGAGDGANVTICLFNGIEGFGHFDT